MEETGKVEAQKVTSEKIECLRQRGEQLKSDLRALGNAALDLAEDRIGHTRAAIREAAEQVKQAGDSKTRRLEEEINSRPLGAVLIAAGAGFLIGLFYARRV